MMRGLLFSLLCQQALKRQGRPSGLIGQYKPYLNSNDSPTRDILKDYSGQGHDIQLYNFGWVEESGYSTTNYPGALVSDGVDDYGLCENFPALTIEKGFTVIGIRKWLDTSKQGVSFAIGSGASSYNLNSVCELIDNSNRQIVISYNQYSVLPDNSYQEDLFYFTSEKYNGTPITKGTIEAYNGKLFIFTNKKSTLDWISSVALYALEIYDHDLTDEEIQSVKEAMISEYEKETGNILEGV